MDPDGIRLLLESPHILTLKTPAKSSAGLRGQMRSAEISDIVSTPPGASTRTASAKNSERDEK